jgi:hypothetical protein
MDIGDYLACNGLPKATCAQRRDVCTNHPELTMLSTPTIRQPDFFGGAIIAAKPVKER